MGTIYEAIELWSANLYQQVRMLAGGRGWATRAFPYLFSPEPARFLSFTATTVNLPGGMGASFTPRSQPDGDSWIIDVRRTDGVVPSGAAGGIFLSQAGHDGYALHGALGELSDARLAQILDELAAAE